MILEDFFNRIEAQCRNQLPFVVYRKPNKTEVSGLLQSGDELFFTKNFTEKGFVFSPFDDRKKTVLIPLSISEVISTDHLNAESHSELVEVQPKKESASVEKPNNLGNWPTKIVTANPAR